MYVYVWLVPYSPTMSVCIPTIKGILPLKYFFLFFDMLQILRIIEYILKCFLYFNAVFTAFK